MASSENTKAVQDSEIEAIKASFYGKVRVISGIGEFTHVVTMHPDGSDLHLKFQLSENYPHTSPTISIRSSVLSADDIVSLTNCLQNEATSRAGHMMLADLMGSCLFWLEDNNVDVSAKMIATKCKEKKKGGKSKEIGKTEKAKIKTLNENKSEKKPPMRTAADVIKRLQWDEAVNKEDFVVGYMDRIVGLVEKNFTAFTWEDLASVDWYSLAIPQHRIQYFKYKTEKVWDKNERLDNVFGSTGGKLTLVEAVKKYEDKQKELCANEAEEATDENEAYGADMEEEIETETDQDIHVSQSDEETEAMANSETRPNHFVALQVTDKSTVEKLVAAQANVLKKYPKYGDFKTPPNGFHLTLAILRLDTFADNQACIEAMNSAKPKLKQLAENCKPLTFEGLDHFNERVIFAKVKYSPEFLALVDEIREVLGHPGLIMETSAFKPHLTLFNVSRSAFAGWDKNNVWLNLVDDVDAHFGSQSVDNIHVCKMGTLPKGASTEFYQDIFRMDIKCQSEVL